MWVFDLNGNVTTNIWHLEIEIVAMNMGWFNIEIVAINVKQKDYEDVQFYNELINKSSNHNNWNCVSNLHITTMVLTKE